MERKRRKLPFGALKLLLGVLIVLCSLWITQYLNIVEISALLPSLSPSPIQIIGAATIIVGLPIFLTGIFFSRYTGFKNESRTFRVSGIYCFIRNPVYSGMYTTLFGIGLIVNRSGIVIAGVLGFICSCALAKAEEKHLIKIFGKEYIDYRNTTPMMIPNFPLLLRILIGKK